MKSLQNKPNTVAPGGDYPYGDVKDNPGNNTGTPVNRLLLGDWLRNIEKIMDLSGITPNELDDNEANGYQILEAMQKMFKPYKSIMMSVVSGVVTIHHSDFSETITFTGTPGSYTINASANIFPREKTIATINHVNYQTIANIAPSMSNESILSVYSYSAIDGSPAPLSQMLQIEIRVYS